MKKKAAAFFAMLLLSAVATTLFVRFGKANPYIQAGEVPPDNSAKPPVISLSSPENKVYTLNEVALTFNVSLPESPNALFRQIVKVSYNASWQNENVTLYKNYDVHFPKDTTELGPDFTEFSCNLNLTGIPEGNHNVTISAIGRGFYPTGIMEVSWFYIEAYFSINFTITTNTQPFPTALVATASGASIAIIGIGLMVYFKKRNR